MFECPGCSGPFFEITKGGLLCCANCTEKGQRTTTTGRAYDCGYRAILDGGFTATKEADGASTAQAAPSEETHWAIVELLGHIKTGGRVSKDEFIGAGLLRLDVPQADGSMVTQLINPSSIYRLTFTSEDAARAGARCSASMPIAAWELPQLAARAATAAAGNGEDYDPEVPY